MKKYLFYSIVVTIIDVIAVWLLMKLFKVPLVYANTIGVILGFVIHYFLASKSVFDTSYGILGFAVYLGTFIFGIAFANYLIYVCYHYIFYFLSANLNFLLSKGVSIALPFFIQYYVRKYIYICMAKYKKSGEKL